LLTIHSIGADSKTRRNLLLHILVIPTVSSGREKEEFYLEVDVRSVAGGERDLGDRKLRKITQIALVVKDIERAKAVWAQLLGVEEPATIETESRESTHMTFEGVPSEGRAKLSFFNFENIVLELIEPIGGPSTWQDFLEKRGEGIHHIAFQVEDLEETLDRFEKIEVGIEQKGEFKGGCYVYTDSKSELGAVIELLHSYS